MTELKEDACTIQLLELVQRGHDLIAQVLKHSNDIPWCFRHDFYEIQEQQKEQQQEEEDSKLSFWYIFSKQKRWNEKSFLWRKPLASYRTNATLFSVSVETTQYEWKKKKNNHTNHYKTKTKKDLTTDKAYTQQQDESIPQDDMHLNFPSILMDFDYLASPEIYDNYTHLLPKDSLPSTSKEENIQDVQRRIIAKQQELERKLVEEYQDTISSFVQLFHKIYKYYLDITKFWKDVSTGQYIHHSTQSILEHEERLRQLLCELLYLFGTVLIVLDLYIPGTIRERFIIAHYRYCTTTLSTSTLSPMVVTGEGTFDDICKAFQRCTKDYHHHNHQQQQQQQQHDMHNVTPIVQSTSYMTRFPLDTKLVQGVMNCIMDHDIYPIYTQAYPSYKHRSTRWSKQAQRMAVIVHFQPDILKSNSLYCRQMIDRFFSNRWRIPLYNGEILDIRDEWMDDRYAAAQSELHHVLGQQTLGSILSKRTMMTLTTLQELNRCMDQDKLSSDYVLDHFDYILNVLRDANDSLQWEMLHRGSRLFMGKSPTYTRVIDDETIVELIFATSCFDEMVLHAFQDVMKRRHELYMVRQSFMLEKVYQLSNHFFGRDSLPLVDKNEEIGTWFQNIGKEMELLSWNSLNGVEDIQFFMDAITEMTHIDIIDKNNHIKSVMRDVQKCLVQMSRLQGLRSNVCEIIETISDFSACRGSVEDFIPLFHFKVKTEPKNTSLLSPFFVKCTSFLKSTVVSGIGTNHPSAVFVRNVHTAALVAYVKEVLNVIPATVFSSLGRMIEQNNISMKELPNKIEVDAFVNYNQFDESFRLAELTYELSTLARGINDMEYLYVETVKLEPQRLLEEGLRKELVRRISFAMHSILQFDINFDRNFKSHQIFCDRFQKTCLKLERNLDALQRAMIWVQDFLNVNGIEMYYQELKRIICHSVNIETGVLNHRKSFEVNDTTTIPSFPKSSDDQKAFTFMGRIINALLKLVDYKYCEHNRMSNAWCLFDGEALFDMKSMRTLRSAVGAQGMKGLVHLLEHHIQLELKRFYKFYEKTMVTYGATLEKFRDDVCPEWEIHEKGIAFYDVTLSRITKLIVPIQTFIYRIGQLQLLRKMFLDELFIGNRFESLKYPRTMNHHEHNTIYLNVQNMQLQTQLSKPPALEGLPPLLALFIIHQLPKMSYNNGYDATRGKSEGCCDGGLILVGISTVLNQFHTIYAKATIALLNQYIWVCTEEIEFDRPAASETTTEVTEIKVAVNILKALSTLCQDSKEIISLSTSDLEVHLTS